VKTERVRFLRGVLVGALLGCGGVADPSQGGCPGPVAFQASPGSSPTFTWQPSCRASALVITTNPAQPGALPALVWSVSEPDDSNRIVPPVQFGVAPPGARSAPNPAAPLEAGASYRLTLYARAASGGDGVLAFTLLTP
jgi:hypothetical protein